MNPELAAGVMIPLGYAWQWARAPKKIPNALSYGVFVALGVVAWWLVTPDSGKLIADSPREALLAALMYVMAARGVASTSSDTKLAKKTDSL